MKKALIILSILVLTLKQMHNPLNGQNPLGVSGYDEGYSIAVDASGNVYGLLQGTVDFDPGADKQPYFKWRE